MPEIKVMDVDAFLGGLETVVMAGAVVLGLLVGVYVIRRFTGV